MKTILVDAIDCFTDRNGNIFEAMHGLLEAFPNKKILLTGADDEQSKSWRLDTMPYEVFTLKHDPEKSDSRYYEILLERFSLNKDDVVYFEHGEEAVRSARTAGITTYRYDHEEKDLAKLKKFLMENL